MRIRRTFYASFWKAPAATRGEALTWLGHKNGGMRPKAIKEDCACVFAHRGGKLIGWATLHKKKRGVNRLAVLQVFVSEEHRRRGIGTSLIDELLKRAKSEHERVLIGDHDEGVRKFFKANGFE
jgi:GNAT superfamily N-acetyltransferase